jgi:hypothetical protein
MAGLGGKGAAPQLAVHSAASVRLDMAIIAASPVRQVADTHDLIDIRAALAIWPISALAWRRAQLSTKWTIPYVHYSARVFHHKRDASSAWDRTREKRPDGCDPSGRFGQH